MLSTQEKYPAISHSVEPDLWGSDDDPGLNREIQSCLEYAKSPTWKMAYESIQSSFVGFKDLQSIELGCGLGKVSLLFSLLGAKTALVDFSQKQIRAANYLHHYFGMQPKIIKADLLRLPREFFGKFDVAMSFGTAEHFFEQERQMAFNAHFNVLKTNGMAIIHVPNKFGIIYKFARCLRKLLGLSICNIAEKAFTRKELIGRMSEAGFQDIIVCGGDTLLHDFNRFFFNFIRFLGKNRDHRTVEKRKIINLLIQLLRKNNQKIGIMNNYFSYPLVAIGKKLS